MDDDFLELLEQAFRTQQIDSLTMDLTYDLMRLSEGNSEYSYGDFLLDSTSENIAH